MLFLDGVYVENDYGSLRFHGVKAPDFDELKALVHAISHRVARFLEKRGFLERDAENSYLAPEPDDDDAMVQLQGHWITYRIAVGPQQGRKVFTLQTLPPDDDSSGGSGRVAKEAGFSLHAGVSTEAHQRDKLERLCRYITRPAVSEKHLTRFHGVFARGGLPSNSKFRVRVTPAKRGSGRKRRQPTGAGRAGRTRRQRSAMW